MNTKQRGISLKVGIASDHGGYQLKEELKKAFPFVDYGTDSEASVDYPDFAKKLGQAVESGEVDLGVAICGTGIGISIVLNKMKGIRAALCHDEFTARMARRHNDANVLCIGGRVTGVEVAKALTQVFLDEAFEGGRHEARLNKIKAIEEE